MQTARLGRRGLEQAAHAPPARIEQGQFDKATSLINLAKDEYVEALRLDPHAWNVKYNLDVTSRLLRDLPEAQPPEDAPREAPKELWTDIPGTPKGEP